MDLHYSQTAAGFNHRFFVSLPYGFTLFSNLSNIVNLGLVVSLPYGFTLFSNHRLGGLAGAAVSLPYGFTLFSNKISNLYSKHMFHYLMDLHYSQTCIQAAVRRQGFHYLMDLHYSQTIQYKGRGTGGFTTLWIYTILKPGFVSLDVEIRFTTLWIYTILKPSPKG